MDRGILGSARLEVCRGGLTALLIATPLVFCTAQHVRADGDTNDCRTDTVTEKSIVVAKSKRSAQDRQAFGEAPVAVASDREDAEVLEPIARVSEYEPELAEPELAEPMVTASDRHAVWVADKIRPRAKSKSTVASLSKSQASVAGFNGVRPGISLRDEVLAQWGEPDGGNGDAPVLSYQFDKLYTVKIHFDGSRVGMIRIILNQPREASELVDRLRIGDLRAATLRNEQAEPVALVFPERGIELGYQSADIVVASDILAGDHAPLVQEIAIRPIEAEAFILRAENDLHGAYAANIQDLQQALELDPKSARAFWLLSAIRLSIGQVDKAELLAARAVELVPEEDAYRLQWTKCLRRQARYDGAVEQARHVLEGSTATPVMRAEALYQMGLLASLGSKSIAQRAVALHLKAIDIADRSADDEDTKIKQTARKLLIDAHLAIALEVARGKWQKKAEYVPQWIARASALAEQPTDDGEHDLRSRLQVAVSSLAAIANLDEPIDPDLWILEVEETSAKLRQTAADKLVEQQIDWEMGLAYFRAAQIEHRRGQSQRAIRYGKQAESKLTPLAKSHRELPDTDHLLGLLYFQLGAVYAVHQENHGKACEWYDRAAELLLQPVPVTSLASPSQHGDALVSMGVSYWQTGNRELALELTQAGADLIEQAVAGGILSSEALAVPYGNLAAMHDVLGNSEPATRYAQLASKHAPMESTADRR